MRTPKEVLGPNMCELGDRPKIKGHMPGLHIDIFSNPLTIQESPDPKAALRVFGMLGGISGLKPADYAFMIPELNDLLSGLGYSVDDFEKTIVPHELLSGESAPKEFRRNWNFIRNLDYRSIVKLVIILLRSAVPYLSEEQKLASANVLNLIARYETSTSCIGKTISDISESIHSTLDTKLAKSKNIVYFETTKQKV